MSSPTPTFSSIPPTTTPTEMPVFNLYDKANITWYQVQNNNVSSAAFAVILLWSFSTLYKSVQYYMMKSKPIYALNVAQAAFMLVKTIAATYYVILLGDLCEPRAFFLSVPLVLSLDCAYYIMLIKLLLFTPFRITVRVVFFLALLAHAVINFIGVSQRDTRLGTNGMCKDVYPLIYKQQYIVEIFLECFTAIVLIHGLAIKSRVNGQVVSSTFELLNQLRKNEHLRVFAVMFMIALKLILTYYTNFLTNFDHLYFTHGVDQARSAIICWALMRDYRKLVKTSSAGGSHPNSSNVLSGKHTKAGLDLKSGSAHMLKSSSGKGVKSQTGSFTGAPSMPRILNSKMTDHHDAIFEDNEDLDVVCAEKSMPAESVESGIDHRDMIKSTETISNVHMPPNEGM
ncbi:hypothetical protein BASA50_008899 [Batrachochytrium salamandrivorans]|uniref:G-protein coupled receptors family 1 profile domain-containing protein n=1 Tax=Batrachochytrium salamandrivorans TaxID=1357716 RepID=A0ABQ8F2B5_9FUNG|nr:hypothetical protein BASA50_008899 [Batrachochytrium salamandrivorans]